MPVEAVAERVGELLRGWLARLPQLLTPTQVARRFAVSRTWVYEHADELGAVRLGTGPRARLRFDLDRLAMAISSAPRPAGGSRARSMPLEEDADLLPVYGHAGRGSATERNRWDVKR